MKVTICESMRGSTKICKKCTIYPVKVIVLKFTSTINQILSKLHRWIKDYWITFAKEQIQGF
jgi:hypothetical protein